MVYFQKGSTTVTQNANGDLNNEIAHLSSICAQPCVFTGPDAEAGALTYAGVRVLLLRSIEQQENMARLYESVQSITQETRTSISNCMQELCTLREHVSVLQQNIHEVYSVLKSHGVRLDHLDNITRTVGNFDHTLTSLEQRIQTNTNNINILEQQQRDCNNHLHGLSSSDHIDRRMRELNDALNHRLSTVERAVQEVQVQKADVHQVSSIVMSQLQSTISPLEMDVASLYRLWDLNKADVHHSVQLGVQNRVHLLHATPPFTSLVEMLRTPELPTVTVGPALMGGTSNINVQQTSYQQSYSAPPLSPRTAATYQQQSSYLGIEVGPASDSASGVIVTRVLPGTPASSAGLREGDILLAMNDQGFSSVTELVVVTRQCLSSKPPSGCYLSITRLGANGQEKVNVWVP